MKNKENQIITCKSGDQKIMGEILERTKYYFKIRIIYPYVGWTDERTTDEGEFLTEEGDELIEELLRSGYEKLVKLDKRMHKSIKAYDELLEDLSEISQLQVQDEMNKKRAEMFLKLWFFDSNIFLPWKTRIPFSHFELDYFMNVFNEYKTKGVKIYLSAEN